MCGNIFTVEVDDTYACKQKYNVFWFYSNVRFGWWRICRETNEIFLKFARRGNSETLTDIIVNYFATGTKIIKDCRQGV